MGRVRYAKSRRDLERSAVAQAEFLDSSVRSIRCVYETDAEVAQAVVPKPLESTPDPMVHISFSTVAMHVAPDVTIEIGAASVGVRVRYNDIEGIYLLTMPMTTEAAVVKGREIYGEPKKIAKIDFEVKGEEVSARVERMGIAYLGVRGTRVEKLGPRELTEYAYCYKAFPSCEKAGGFDSDPQLARLEWRRHDRQVWRVEGELELVESPFDPVIDLPVRRMVSLEYTEGTSESNGRVLRPVPGDWLLPFIHQRYDEPGIDGLDV